MLLHKKDTIKIYTFIRLHMQWLEAWIKMKQCKKYLIHERFKNDD